MADFDLNAILNSLTPEDIENLKQTAASVLGGMGDKETSQKEQRTSEKKQQQNQNQNQQGLQLDDLLKTLGGLGNLGDLSGGEAA